MIFLRVPTLHRRTGLAASFGYVNGAKARAPPTCSGRFNKNTYCKAKVTLGGLAAHGVAGIIH